MRTAEGMSPAEFTQALTAAQRGLIVTDTGAGEELNAVLLDIAQTGPNAPTTLTDAARAAFKAQRSRSRVL